MKNQRAKFATRLLVRVRVLPSDPIAGRYFGRVCQVTRRVSARGNSRCLTALCLLLLLAVAGPENGLAKPRTRTRNLSAQYHLNKKPADLDGVQIKIKLLRLLSKPGVKLFLDVIQEAEGGKPNIMVGGCHANNLKQHPALTLPFSCRYRIRISGKWRVSTASGNYQLTFTNWKQLASFLGLPDFSEVSQALAALELIRRGGGAANAVTPHGLFIKRRIQRGFEELVNGNLNRALCLATYDWASSTCSPLPARGKKVYANIAGAVQAKQKAKATQLIATGRGSADRNHRQRPALSKRRSNRRNVT